MDFFVQNLVDENCLVVSPVSLISRAIHYLYVSKATATIVIPVWLSSYFWPIISMKFASSIGLISGSESTLRMLLSMDGTLTRFWVVTD